MDACPGTDRAYYQVHDAQVDGEVVEPAELQVFGLQGLEEGELEAEDDEPRRRAGHPGERGAQEEDGALPGGRGSLRWQGEVLDQHPEGEACGEPGQEQLVYG